MSFINPNNLTAISKIVSITSVLLLQQTDIIAQSNIAVAPLKMNVFYIGVDNPVSIAASGANDSRIIVTINGGGGSITKTSAGLYNVRVTEVTDECIVSVSTNGKLVGTSTFRVRHLPPVFATVGGHISGDSMPVSEFKAQAGVGLSIKDFPYEMRYQVTSFSLAFDGDQDKIIEFNCQGSIFPPEARQSITQYIKPGSLVTIDNIRILGPDNRSMKIPSLVYYIK